MKKYIDAQLQVVRVHNADIVTVSDTLGFGENINSTDIEAYGSSRRMDDWDAGY